MTEYLYINDGLQAKQSEEPPNDNQIQMMKLGMLVVFTFVPGQGFVRVSSDNVLSVV